MLDDEGWVACVDETTEIEEPDAAAELRVDVGPTPEPDELEIASIEELEIIPKLDKIGVACTGELVSILELEELRSTAELELGTAVELALGTFVELMLEMIVELALEMIEELTLATTVELALETIVELTLSASEELDLPAIDELKFSTIAGLEVEPADEDRDAEADDD
ncbi:hypothetical protein ACN47E_008038 [Coniothyrium glycines]